MDRKKILFIEDDENLLNNVQSILEEEGYEIMTLVDGTNALSAAKQWKPDLIICDIKMPSKDGYTVLEELINDEQTKAIPFMFLTARVEKDDFRKGMQLGADDYIFKPFDMDDLLNSIKIRLRKSSFKSNSNNSEKNGNGHKDNEFENKVYDMDEKIMVHIGSKMKLYPIKAIKFINSLNPYIRIKFIDGQTTLQRQTLNDWESKLPAKYFARIHRSTIINTEFITKMEKLNNNSFLIRLKGEEEPFHTSKRYSSKLRDKYLPA